MGEISDPRCLRNLCLTPGINGADSSCIGAVHASSSSGTRKRPATPNHPVERTAHSAGFVGYSWRFLLWAAAHRERSAAEANVKDQYFGDVNDFRKYGLLRLLTLPGRLRLGVCWMLTEPDARTDGRFLNYLRQPKKYRHRDPDLFDWLKQVIGVEQDRRTARIEASTLLRSVLFKSDILADHKDKRRDYFSDCGTRFAGCDLVFFDPDNGLEIKSTQRGHKDSCKFLYWDEACGTFEAGSSVLIYQHFIREERDRYIARAAAELQRRTRAAAIFSFRTPHVLFLLAAQERHAGGFRKQLGAVQSLWAPKQIIAAEHTPPNQALHLTRPAMLLPDNV